MTKSYTFEIACKGFCDIHDISAEVSSRVRESGINDGIVCVFVPGSTAAITTIEYERGAVKDLKRAIEQLAPEGDVYAHNDRWGDGNGFAHVRAAMLGPSLSVPLNRGQMLLGTWQQIILCDFDNRSRNRRVAVQIVGDQR